MTESAPDEWPDEFGPYLEDAMRNEEFAAAYQHAQQEPPGTERMAVALTVYVDVPADITEAEMDHRALDIAHDVAVDHGEVSKPVCWLVAR